MSHFVHELEKTGCMNLENGRKQLGVLFYSCEHRQASGSSSS